MSGGSRARVTLAESRLIGTEQVMSGKMIGEVDKNVFFEEFGEKW